MCTHPLIQCQNLQASFKSFSISFCCLYFAESWIAVLNGYRSYSSKDKLYTLHRVSGMSGQSRFFSAGNSRRLIQLRMCVCDVSFVYSLFSASENIIQKSLSDKNLIEPSLNLASGHLLLFSVKCAFLPHRHLSTTDMQLVFMFCSSHKTSTPSLHTLDPLMRLIGTAFSLTLFGSFFIFFALSAHSKHRPSSSVWERESKGMKVGIKVGDMLVSMHVNVSQCQWGFKYPDVWMHTCAFSCVLIERTLSK